MRGPKCLGGILTQVHGRENLHELWHVPWNQVTIGMIKRLWLLLSVIWALLFLINGDTKANGIQLADLELATVPFVAGLVLVFGLRFVLFGTQRDGQ